MKTMKNIFKFILTVLAVAAFFSCDLPISLGDKLDIEGPIITTSSPSQRQSVSPNFSLEGTAQDLTGVERMEIKAFFNGEVYIRQWRYNKGKWEVSDNYGSSWSPYADATWSGSSKSASWKINIDMTVVGQILKEGEYTFIIQAWDKGDFSDDNSYKSLVLIIDKDPPKVDISYPYIYRSKTDPVFIDLDGILDDSNTWQDPAYLGKFITQEFDLSWQIDDYNDIWSIDIRLYNADVVIDSDTTIPLPDNYIYKYSKNLPPPPPKVNLSDCLEVNGSLTIPDLTSPAEIYNDDNYQGGEIKESITEKTTVKIVTTCYDVAGNAEQKKTVGYFIYWPRANMPWIVFSESIFEPDYTETISEIEKTVYKVYPSKTINATAYQAQGVKEVKYTLYKCDSSGSTLSPVLIPERSETVIPNPPSKNGFYSTIFSWEFIVPQFTGYYIVEAQAFSTKNKPSEKYSRLFLVNDITFPDFPTPPKPKASEPLFLAIKDNKITIEGEVSDSTGIESLCLVWINPESDNYAAMSQLAYFRDKDYGGWKQALGLSPGSGGVDASFAGAYDSSHPNRLWRLTTASIGRDPVTDRLHFSYSQEISLDELNIGPGKRPLSSQVFLFRLENPGKKCTIITYAPQGDTLAPTIKISDVKITNSDDVQRGDICEPGKYAVIPQFNDGDKIIINGTWKEDSAESLDINTYFKSNFVINVNNQLMPLSALTIIKTAKTDGTWTLTATVKASAVAGNAEVPQSKLKDTLTIDVMTSDIGGNVSQIGSSWLIQSDNLRLLRISSEAPDGIYSTNTTDKTIEIFLEFSKPVKLAYPNTTNPTIKPELILSSASGNMARAEYKDGQINQNSRQYFVYTIAATQNTNPDANPPEYLNVKGLYYNGTTYTTTTPYSTANYPFAWSNGAATTDTSYEEVRLTLQESKKGDTLEGATGTPKFNGYYVRTLPTKTSITDPDYQFTLTAGKNITIDTTAPTVTTTSIKANSAVGYYNTGDIYFTVTFSEPVMITGVPRLPMNIGGTTSWTSNDVRVNDKSITFKYTIKSDDTSNGNEVYISSSRDYDYESGTITDIAGNPFPLGTGAGTIRNLTQTQRTLTGIYIETALPSAPTVRLYPGTNTTPNTTKVFEQYVNGTDPAYLITGESGTADKDLSCIYEDYLWLEIQGSGSAYKREAIEYSVDGKSWVRAPNTTGTPFQLLQTGKYEIFARQIDQAGNVSPNTKAVKFDWDKGALLTRISSDSANGTYSHIAGNNQINLTFYFRKSIRFKTSTDVPSLTLNAQNSSNAYITRSNGNIAVSSSADYSSLTFTYTVQNGEKTTSNLAITAFSDITAWDGSAVGNGVNVSKIIADNYTALSTPKLDATKEFTVVTGDLTNTRPVFVLSGDSGTSSNEADANFHGIRSDDGSYWTTLRIPFNRPISKGTGIITIKQSGTNYRLPAVMTESQYNRLKTIANIDTYYIKGTNGYINGSGSDTSNKYVLQYSYDPRSDVTADNTGFTGNKYIPSTFFSDFREKEKIEINVNANAVSIDGSTLIIRLTGSSAPQVPGANYEITYPAGLVTDAIGIGSAAGAYTAASGNNAVIAIGGVAKPFVRIKKTRETISVNANPSITQPRLVAAQPFLANARIDCRTPGSAITYTPETGTATYTGNAPGTTGSSNNWNVTGNQRTDINNNTNMSATRPGNATGNTYTNSSQITFGYATGTTAPTISNVQGFQWWVLAQATVTVSIDGTNKNYTSTPAEEVAYRTVISYQLRNANGAISAGQTGQQILASGDQIWIRGGDAIGSSSIPGFPFTWEDNWDNLSGKRAGIRLMTLVSTSGSTMNNSLWRLVTWDMNTTAYVDFIMGHDTDNPTDVNDTNYANIVWQYGPYQYAYQRDGWTSYKVRYPIYAGKHRWCDTGYDWGSKQAINFSGTFSARPEYSANTPASYPGVNSNN